MPRRAREMSSTGTYHIMVRGVNKQPIFHDSEDCEQFLRFLHEIMKDLDFKLFAFCFMKNHVHLLIQITNNDLSLVMKRLGTRYAYYFNVKYDRVGHLFQDRFRSESVETEHYLFTVLRYIHQNPVEAGIVTNMNEYQWSSYMTYLGEGNRFSAIIDTEFILRLLDDKQDQARISFEQLMNIKTDETCLDENRSVKCTDKHLKEQIKNMLGGKPLSTIRSLTGKDRNIILRRVKAIEGTSIRQIARVTGINRGIIQRA